LCNAVSSGSLSTALAAHFKQLDKLIIKKQTRRKMID